MPGARIRFGFRDYPQQQHGNHHQQTRLKRPGRRACGRSLVKRLSQNAPFGQARRETSQLTSVLIWQQQSGILAARQNAQPDRA